MQVLTDFTPAAYPCMGVSGFLEAAGLALWGYDLWRIMNRGRRAESVIPSPPPQLVQLKSA